MTSTVITVIVVIFIIIFGLGLLVYILYLINLQNTLRAASPENRRMPPANVWLLLIPIFHIYWFYVVAKSINATIEAEYASKGQLLDTPKPTYKLGMAIVILNVVNIVFLIIRIPLIIATMSGTTSGSVDVMSSNFALQGGGAFLAVLSPLVSFAGFILWIIYWVQTAGYKNKMKMLSNNKIESQIFGQM